MTLPASGAISFSAVNIELGLTSTAQISLNDAAVRTLFGDASGAVAMSDAYGKSNTSVPTAPTSVSASASSCHSASVSFSAPGCTGHLTIDYYQAISSPGCFTATGTSPISVSGLSPSTAYTFRVRAHNSKGYGSYSSASGSVSTTAVRGSSSYTTPGTYTWYVPSGVTSISFFAIGGGTGGTNYSRGGGGGGSIYANNRTTHPGQPNCSFTVYVGSGGSNQGGNGTYSAVVGNYCGIIYRANPGCGNQGGGGYSNCSGGYANRGGPGYGGGGGAAGYQNNSSTGISGGTGQAAGNPGCNGYGGGGGGGGNNQYIYPTVINGGYPFSTLPAGGGGGTGIYGQGTSGTGGSGAQGFGYMYGVGQGGGGGSGGNNGSYGSGCNPSLCYHSYSCVHGNWTGGAGGSYGAGGGAGGYGFYPLCGYDCCTGIKVYYAYQNIYASSGGAGAGGAVRIVWPGSTRQFPSTDVGA